MNLGPTLCVCCAATDKNRHHECYGFFAGGHCSCECIYNPFSPNHPKALLPGITLSEVRLD